ncbi:MAG: hypothetical protein Q9212_006368 [Teloschistes hypoglaucus]
MSPKRGRSKRPSLTKAPKLRYKSLLPPCKGPKLHPFPDRYAPIEFERMLSDPEAALAHVFEVTIGGKPYALKVFKHTSDTQFDDAFDFCDTSLVSQDVLDHPNYHFESFYRECRAYGRLRDSKLDGKIAVACHGYMMLPAEYEDELKRRFGAGDWYRGDDEPDTPVAERQALKAIVKDLVLEETIWTPKVIRTRLSHLKKMRAHGIYAMDIKADNYVGGLFVDFGIAYTTPHACFDTDTKSWIEVEKSIDLADFDVMIQDLGIKTTPDRTSLISNSSFARPYASSQAQEKRAEVDSTPHAKDPQSRVQPFGDRGDGNSTSLKLFPQFLDFPNISSGDPEHHRYFISSYLSSRSKTSPRQCPPGFTFPRPIDKITVLICSHNTRDRRCGVIGPLLNESFNKYANPKTVDVGMVSHVGGHAFAGNVIIYIPPGHKISPSQTGDKDHDTELSPLAGSGVWYGRVEPKHVQGILEETVHKGKIIAELWRGGLQTQHSREKSCDSQSTSFETWKKRAATAQMMRIP